jgi:hypothetical protein
MGCDEILSGLQEILQWLQHSITGMVFDEGSEVQGVIEDGDDDWCHFETSPPHVEHWE